MNETNKAEQVQNIKTNNNEMESKIKRIKARKENNSIIVTDPFTNEELRFSYKNYVCPFKDYHPEGYEEALGMIIIAECTTHADITIFTPTGYDYLIIERNNRFFLVESNFAEFIHFTNINKVEEPRCFFCSDADKGECHFNKCPFKMRWYNFEEKVNENSNQG